MVVIDARNQLQAHGSVLKINFAPFVAEEEESSDFLGSNGMGRSR